MAQDTQPRQTQEFHSTLTTSTMAQETQFRLTTTQGDQHR